MSPVLHLQSSNLVTSSTELVEVSRSQSFKNYLLNVGHSAASVRTRERNVLEFCNWCEDQGIEAQLATYNELLGYMQHLKKRELKQRTIQLVLASLKHYFTWAISAGVRESLPTEGITVRNVQRRLLYHIIPMAELEALYPKIGTGDSPSSVLESSVLSPSSQKTEEKQSWYNRKMRQVAYGLMVWQGMDIAELSRLALTDVKLREGKIAIAGTRRSNERTLKLESAQIMDLMEYLHVIRPEYLRTNPDASQSEACPANAGLFISRKGGVWGQNFGVSLLKSVSSLHPGITSFKQLHASVITHWLKNHNLRQVQYMAGHRYVSSTEAYLVNDLDDLQEDITRFHPLS